MDAVQSFHINISLTVIYTRLMNFIYSTLISSKAFRKRRCGVQTFTCCPKLGIQYLKAITGIPYQSGIPADSKGVACWYFNTN